MKRFKYCLFVLIFVINLKAQNKNEIISEIKSDIYLKGEKINNAFELLKVDKYNEFAIDYICYSYARTNRKDSISSFFNNLIFQNEKDREPYIIRIKYEFLETPNNDQKIKYLEKGLSFYPSDEIINFNLAVSYYNTFIQKYTKNKNDIQLDAYAKKSLKLLEKVITLKKKTSKNIAALLSIHLKNYLDPNDTIKYVSRTIIPIDQISEFPNNWEKKISINIFEKIKKNEVLFEWYSEQFKALEEEKLERTHDVYRFTWLRTFHKPISIRVEKKKNQSIIYWKECEGMGGFEPGKLIINSNRKITNLEWSKLYKMVHRTNFWSLKIEDDEISGYDGSRWILEGVKNEKYHIVHRFMGQEITDIGLYLIKLTGLRISEEEIY